MKPTNMICLGKAAIVYTVVPLKLRPLKGHYFGIAILSQAENFVFPYDLTKCKKLKKSGKEIACRVFLQSQLRWTWENRGFRSRK